MADLFMNFQAGVLTADPGSGGTTLNSGNFAFLPAVASPFTIRLALDPDGLAGTPEIVTVTAHTASATSVTVTRGQETSFGAGAARAHAIDTVWRHVLTRASIIEMMVPAGSVIATLGTTADAGYALIDGSTLTNGQVKFPATYARIPASWKSAPDIILPDWRGRTLFSDDTGAVFALGASGGANTHAITQAELPAVALTINDPGHTHSANAVSDAATAGATDKMLFRATNFIAGGTPTTGSNTTGITTGNLGSGTAMSMLAAHGVVNWQLKTH